MNKEDLTNFLQFCGTPYHFISYARNLLDKLGYQELHEEDEWVELPTNGYVVRPSGAIIAYKYDSLESLLITTSRYDSSDRFLSSLLISRLDKIDSDYIKTHQKPLRCAGYVIIKNKNNAEQILFDSSEEAVPFFTDLTESDYGTPNYSSVLLPYLSKKLNVDEADILDYHLCFIDPQSLSILPDGTVSGHNLKFLAPAFSSLQAFIQSEPKNQMNVFCSFYNENELEFYRSPTIYDDFLTFFINKVFCVDYQKKYLQKTFCICIEGYISHNTQDNQQSIDQVQLLQSNILLNDEESANKESFLTKLPQQKVEYLLSDSTIKQQLPIQGLTLGIPYTLEGETKQSCTLNAMINLFDILKQALTEFH